VGLKGLQLYPPSKFSLSTVATYDYL